MNKEYLSNDIEMGFEVGDVLYRMDFPREIMEWRVCDKICVSEYDVFELRPASELGVPCVYFLVSIDPDAKTFFRKKKDLVRAISFTEFDQLRKVSLMARAKISQDDEYFLEYMELNPERFV